MTSSMPDLYIQISSTHRLFCYTTVKGNNELFQSATSYKSNHGDIKPYENVKQNIQNNMACLHLP